MVKLRTNYKIKLYKFFKEIKLKKQYIKQLKDKIFLFIKTSDNILNETQILKNYKYIYVPLSIVLICISPILFVFFNALSIGFLLYYHTNLRDLFIINVFFLWIWVFLYSCYSYLLVHEPSIPINPGDSLILNLANLVLIIGYTIKCPSICRSVFVETLVILHVLHLVLGFYPTIYFF